MTLYAGLPQIAVSYVNMSFEAAGFNETNMAIIYEIGTPTTSYRPERSINGVVSFELNKGYYIIPKQDIQIEGLEIGFTPAYLADLNADYITDTNGDRLLIE